MGLLGRGNGEGRGRYTYSGGGGSYESSWYIYFYGHRDIYPHSISIGPNTIYPLPYISTYNIRYDIDRIIYYLPVQAIALPNPTSIQMAPTTFSSPLLRRYSSYDCSDYLYTRECAPHRIVIGAIIAVVLLAMIIITALLCIRHRKRKAFKAQMASQSSHMQKQAHLGLHGAEPELQAPPPAYARIDPARVV